MNSVNVLNLPLYENPSIELKNIITLEGTRNIDFKSFIGLIEFS